MERLSLRGKPFFLSACKWEIKNKEHSFAGARSLCEDPDARKTMFPVF